MPEAMRAMNPDAFRRLLLSLGRFARRTWACLWVLPMTCMAVPFVVAAMLGWGRLRMHTGVLEVHGGLSEWWLRRMVPLKGGATAMTIGHVVIGRDEAALDRTRAHERVHVRQAERWGPLFGPAYLLASLRAHRRGGHYYRDNAFERQAREQSGQG